MSSSQKFVDRLPNQQAFRQFSNRSLHQQTFQLVRQSLKETNNLAKERLIEKLKAEKERSQQGKVKVNNFRIWLASLRYNLYIEPTIISWISLWIGLSVIALSFLISLLINAFKINNNFLIGRLAFLFVLLLLICLLIWPILILFLTVVTPKIEINWEQRWQQTKHQYLKKLQYNEKLAKGNVKQAISYFRRKNQTIRFFWNLSWGGIFIGCLPDKDFQEALMKVVSEAWRAAFASVPTTSVPTTKAIFELYQENHFGFVVICFLPILGFFYLKNYRIPVNWLENILSIIEFEEDIELDRSDTWTEEDRSDATNHYFQYASTFYDDEEDYK